MDVPLPNPEWVIEDSESAPEDKRDLVGCSRAMWPRVLAYAQRQDGGLIPRDIKETLAIETWERVLRSMARTCEKQGDLRAIENLEAYLFGAFQHRFRRALRRERLRQEFIVSLPPFLLASLNPVHGPKRISQIEQDLELKEILARMSEWAREVWASRQYGYCWKDIAQNYELTEAQAKMRFSYELKRVRKEINGAAENKQKRGAV